MDGCLAGNVLQVSHQPVHRLLESHLESSVSLNHETETTMARKLMNYAGFIVVLAIGYFGWKFTVLSRRLSETEILRFFETE